MDFDLSSEQSMLAETATRWARDHYGALAQYQDAARQPAGFPAAQWGELGELGLLGLPWSEDEGGIGGGPVETMVVAEAFGRTLMPAPWLASVILAGGVARVAATPEQRATLAPGLIDGSARLAFAHGERQSRYDLTDVATTARRDGDGWVLDGAKTAV
ncbi:alkylation response protein AidB-like acyl-CoA dehydrogenase [Endobacter medicaginis]|uniref:Alkylation response protein AidB-like acyl-CoA dehydrogenase n=1 Tax=Endobacter medicaginis TaxID=1181271 RepID=A0A839URQ0_9PROT|nr:acyl-CoA dehydrogenase family protein [Endobacter medicaginis]MBB3172466.1 alkylation response protein AidB-like acyl-CoA dehydrogenase [Endobacter medicaginis]MCX5474045.1 acyl-CoA/acyl-ACP dehydrogenase [Endobacter medicaginis]